MKFSCLYLFDNSTHTLVEVKIDSLSKETPKQHRYHWLLVDRRLEKVTSLNFVSMSQNDAKSARNFREGVLEFDTQVARYLPTGSCDALELLAGDKVALRPGLSQAIAEFIVNYLRSVDLLNLPNQGKEIPLQP